MSPRLVAAGLLAAALLFCGALAVAKTGGISVAETAALPRKPAATVVAQKLAGPALPTVAKLAEGDADAATEACEETYGIFPCSTGLAGSLVLIAGYGYMLLQGANLISDGSELLLAVMDPGLIGGLVLPILGALPDAAMIVVSGTGGSIADAQEDVAVGIGTLAGSTVMLLSIAWGGSLILGRCDLENGKAVNKKLTKGWHLTETGVTSDAATRLNAYIMIASAFLFLFPQVPTFMGHPHTPLATLSGCIACLVALAAYCVYQVVYPELQKRKKEAAHQKFVRIKSAAMMSSLAKHAGCILMDQDGNVREDALRALFNKFDEDKSGTIDGDELRKVAKMLLHSDSGDKDDAGLREDIAYLMKELDADGDGNITFDEMKTGLTKWLKETRAEAETKAKEGGKEEAAPLMLDTEAQELAEGADGDDDDDDDEEEEEEEALTSQQIMIKAAVLLTGGAVLVGLFADPMVDAVSGFSKASHVPAFFVSFVITPFASNASELVSSLQFAMKKKVKNISLTYSQVYGAVTMNNTMCLGLFLLVVWWRDLTWVFSSEVTTTMFAIIALGVIAASRETFELYWAWVSLGLYPVALALVAFLDYVLGWQ